MSWINPSTLFKTAAVLDGIAVPGHIHMGFDVVYPALNKIPLVGKNAVGQRGAESCWNYTAAGLAMSSCLNWQWARTGGPQTSEESIVFWIIAAIQALNGFRYLQVGEYPVSVMLWSAPLLGVAALWSK